MALTSATISPSLLLIPPPKSLRLSNSPALSLPSASRPRRSPATISQKKPQLWRVCAAPEDALPTETAIETTQQVVSTPNGEEGVSTVVSALLFIAFIGLSLLTIGIIYLAVQDFFQKREREKYEKEDAAKKKKKGVKKTKVRARTGPRGFGQKLEEDDDDDD